MLIVYKLAFIGTVSLLLVLLGGSLANGGDSRSRVSAKLLGIMTWVWVFLTPYVYFADSPLGLDIPYLAVWYTLTFFALIVLVVR